MRAGIDIFQSLNIVFTVAPETVVRSRNGIPDGEVMKWTKKLFIQRLGQPDLRRKTVPEIGGNALTVHSFWCRRQTQHNARLKLLENVSIARGRPMMNFVDDNEVVKVLPHLIP